MVYFTQNRRLCLATTPTLYSALGDIIIRRIKNNGNQTGNHSEVSAS